MKNDQKVILNANDFVTFTNDIKNFIDAHKTKKVSAKTALLWKSKITAIERLAVYP